MKRVNVSVCVVIRRKVKNKMIWTRPYIAQGGAAVQGGERETHHIGSDRDSEQAHSTQQKHSIDSIAFISEQYLTLKKRRIY